MGVLEHDSSMHELADHCYAMSPLKCSLPVLARPILKALAVEGTAQDGLEAFLLACMFLQLMPAPAFLSDKRRWHVGGSG